MDDPFGSFYRFGAREWATDGETLVYDWLRNMPGLIGRDKKNPMGFSARAKEARSEKTARRNKRKDRLTDGSTDAFPRFFVKTCARRGERVEKFSWPAEPRQKTTPRYKIPLVIAARRDSPPGVNSIKPPRGPKRSFSRIDRFLSFSFRIFSFFFPFRSVLSTGTGRSAMVLLVFHASFDP